MRFTILRAISLGIVALLLAVFPGGVWTMLLIVNLRTNPQIPWCVALMGLLLWALWRYLDGSGPPRSSSESRHRLLRANPVSRRGFVWTFIGGILGTVALAGLWIVLLQLVKVPIRPLPDFSKYPLFTIATVIVMACLVSSLPEEAAFRGYFQGFLERKLSGPAAIIVSSFVMTPAHCLTQGFFWPVILFYLLVDSMLGTMAYLTKSILPGIAVHFLGLLLFFTAIWPYDSSRRAVGDAASDLWFWIHVGQFVICGGLALVAFRRLSLVRHVADEA
jgi:membrane protease YdiL (CAAX protease family)